MHCFEKILNRFGGALLHLVLNLMFDRTKTMDQSRQTFSVYKAIPLIQKIRTSSSEEGSKCKSTRLTIHNSKKIKCKYVFISPQPFPKYNRTKNYFIVLDSKFCLKNKRFL